LLAFLIAGLRCGAWAPPAANTDKANRPRRVRHRREQSRVMAALIEFA